jgi:hypothetical protein
MRVKLLTPSRLSIRILDQANMITNRRKMMSRTRSFKKRLFMQHLTAVRPDHAIRKLRVRSRDQEHTSISTIPSIAPSRFKETT